MKNIKTLVRWLAVIEGAVILDALLDLGFSEGFYSLLCLAMIGLTVTLLIKTK